MQYFEERVRKRLSPVTVASVTAVSNHLEVQQTPPRLAVTITADFAGCKRYLTSHNGVWDQYDLIRQFQVDPSTAIYGLTNHTLFEREASLPLNSMAVEYQHLHHLSRHY